MEEITIKIGEDKNIRDSRIPEGFSQYAILVKRKDVDYLGTSREVFNKKLKENGHLFLNEIHDRIPHKRTIYGQLIGWIYNPEMENKIDFEFYDDPKNNYIVIDFKNLDGIILDRI